MPCGGGQAQRRFVIEVQVLIQVDFFLKEQLANANGVACGGGERQFGLFRAVNDCDGIGCLGCQRRLSHCCNFPCHANGQL